VLQQFFRKKTAERKDGDEPIESFVISMQLTKNCRVSCSKLREVMRAPLRIKRGIDESLDLLSQRVDLDQLSYRLDYSFDF
jgi:hypothetical protein